MYAVAKSISWRGAGKILAKLVALVLPSGDPVTVAAKAAFIAGIVITVAQLVVALTNYSSSCGT